MSATKFFIDLLAPLFIAILVLAGLAAGLARTITPVVIGLGGLGIGGLATILIAGLLADGWTRRQTVQQLKSQPKNR